MARFQGKPGGGNRQRNRIDTPPAGRLRRCPLAGRLRHAQHQRRRRGPGPELSRSGSGSRFALAGRPPRRQTVADRPQNRPRNLPRLETRRRGAGLAVVVAGKIRRQLEGGDSARRSNQPALHARAAAAALPQAVAVTAVTRVGNLSPPAVSNLETR